MPRFAQNIRLMLCCSLFLFLAIASQGQDYRFEPKADGTPILNKYYHADYNTEHKQPNWVYYTLTLSNLSGNTPRASSFKDSRQGDLHSASQNDYKGSGYDKGHLCPAADMKLSREAMAETFQMWNMSPQEPSFNRGKWADLEALTRNYIEDETDTLFIATGPVFVNNRNTIGPGKVTVPGFFYKIVYNPKRGGIAFLLPNEKVNTPLRSWQVSIDLIEALTGIDFFPHMPQPRQNEIESQVVWWD